MYSGQNAPDATETTTALAALIDAAADLAALDAADTCGALEGIGGTTVANVTAALTAFGTANATNATPAQTGYGVLAGVNLTTVATAVSGCDATLGAELSDIDTGFAGTQGAAVRRGLMEALGRSRT